MRRVAACERGMGPHGRPANNAELDSVPVPSIRLLATLPVPDRRQVDDAVGDLDWRVSNLPDGRQLADSYVSRAPDAAWAVFVAGEPAGLFALIPYPEAPGSWQTSTYLVPGVRGTGINVALKRAVFTSARQTGFPLTMSIDIRNTRSMAAASKLLAGHRPDLVWEAHMSRWAWVFDLSAVGAQLAPGATPAPGLIAELSRGMLTTLPS